MDTVGRGDMSQEVPAEKLGWEQPIVGVNQEHVEMKIECMPNDMDGRSSDGDHQPQETGQLEGPHAFYDAYPAEAKKKPARKIKRPKKRKGLELDSKLIRHTQMKCERLKKHSCEICEKRFRTRRLVHAHITTHSDPKPYSCETCNKQFADTSSLSSHRHRRSRIKSYYCEICKKKFAFSGDLTKHNRVHTGEKPYSCDICNEKFARTSILSNHRFLHTGKKPFSCDICKIHFTQSGSLITHRLHTGEKPYKCEVCKNQFIQSGSLASRRRRHNKNTLSYR
ncbi:zinc finger protein 22-like [Cydia pomonella]|uniref:zinc finger protein 22-like n=1 Tax=Cydia pomonella TaxID=82600 RepID=UPI002ADDD9B5|nr:zinc finger protein 22-like [Cydia pomonella]